MVFVDLKQISCGATAISWVPTMTYVTNALMAGMNLGSRHGANLLQAVNNVANVEKLRDAYNEATK